MKMISTDYQNGTAVVKLDRGTTNALNLELLGELGETLSRLDQESSVRGLVLGSSNDKFFSIGFDIPQLYGLSKKNFGVFYKAFNQVCLDLYRLPKPTVAALTGHAVAGGCILALCCDYRLIAKGRKLMGLNEIRLGVPVPYLADCVLRNLVGARAARDVVDSGDFYEPEKAFQLGMVDQILLLEQVLPASIHKAEETGSSPGEAFAMIKRNRVEMVEAQILARLKEKQQLFVDRWYSDEARERLRAAMEKFQADN